jgi:hypothetical protein
VEELRKGFKPYVFEMRRDGTVERCVQYDVVSYQLAGHVDIWRRSEAPAYKGKGVEDCLHGTVWAKDEKHAVKIANEHRARFIAEGLWGTGGRTE